MNHHLLTYQGQYLRIADAEQEKRAGGMVCLYPRQDYAEAMAVQGGEPVEDLHCTLAFLGSDLADLSPGDLPAAIGRIADTLPGAVKARVFAHATFNPDGGEDGTKDPCAVYLIGDCPDLVPLQKAVVEVCQARVPSMPDQHEPTTFHITASYAIQRLTFTGPVVFDRLALEWADQTYDFPLADY